MTHSPAFLFDIGKVLLDFDFETSLGRLIEGLPNGEERLARTLEPKDAFERGDIPLEDYITHALECLGPDVSRESFLDHWRNIFTPNLPMWKTVQKLHQAGHRLYLFSNTNEIHVPWILENFEIFRFFNGATYSFEVSFIKPEPDIYEIAIRDHALEPSNTLYIDDLPANIETGNKMGLRSHQYDLNDHASFEQWLVNELDQ